MINEMPAGREMDFAVAEALGEIPYMNTPFYSTDIAAAWKVVEWMRERWKNQTAEPENVSLCRRFYDYLDKQ